MKPLVSSLPLATSPASRHPWRLRGLHHSLSAKLLALIVLFMLLAGVLMQFPSVARYRLACLAESVADGYQLAMILDREGWADPRQERLLLEHAQLLAVRVQHEGKVHTLGTPPAVQARYVLGEQGTLALLWDGLTVFLRDRGRLVAVQGDRYGVPVTVYLDEEQVYKDVSHYTLWVVSYALTLSVGLALLLYWCLQWQVVGSIRCITRNLTRFRDEMQKGELSEPVGAEPGCTRSDEIGFIEAELGRMQRDLRGALHQQQRLAVLGAAVSRINHDFKSILSTVSIASGRLAKVNDPTVQRIAPLLMRSVERAVHLCTEAQDLARGEQIVPERSRFRVADLVDEVGQALLAGNEALDWQVRVPDGLELEADRDRLYRALLNLCRNAVQAMAGQGALRVLARGVDGGVELDVCDTGPGIPEERRGRLFQAFAGSGRQGGVGLGLVTARDLVRAHGGELSLVYTGGEGTCFRIWLPG